MRLAVRAEDPGDALSFEVEGDEMMFAEAGDEPVAGECKARHLGRRGRFAAKDPPS